MCFVCFVREVSNPCLFSISVICDEVYSNRFFVFAIPTTTKQFNYRARVLITTSSSEPVHTTLTVPALGIEVHTTITRYDNADITLPVAARVSNAGTSDNSVIVKSSGDVTVHAFDNESHGNAGFLVLSTSQIGTEYRILNYEPSYNSGHPSFVTLTAIDQATSVQLVTRSEHELTIHLNPFQCYRYEAPYPEDLTGTSINSDRLIQVTSGVFTYVPKGGSSGEGLLISVPPVDVWGQHFVLAPILTKTCGYIYRVISDNRTTATININNATTVILQSSDFHEGDVEAEIMTEIHADKPVLVAKYMKNYYACNARGDPAMIAVSPIAWYHKDVVTFPVFRTTVNRPKHYSINVITSCNDTESLVFDDTISMSGWVRLSLGNGSWCCVSGEVTPGVHSVASTSPSALFTVSIYMMCLPSSNSGCGTSYAYQARSMYTG